MLKHLRGVHDGTHFLFDRLGSPGLVNEMRLDRIGQDFTLLVELPGLALEIFELVDNERFDRDQTGKLTVCGNNQIIKEFVIRPFSHAA